MTDSLASVRDEEEFAEESEDTLPGGSKDIVTCPYCGKVCMNGYLLRTHCYNMHGAVSSKKERSGRLLCPESDCGCMLVSYDALCKHCEEKHDFVPDDTRETFDSVDEFKFWLAQLAITSGSMVKRRGERKTADGLSMGDFHCSFDGKKRETPSIRAPDRNPYNRRVPSRKLGFSCPAHIRYTVNIDGSVVIRAQTKHFGHETKPTSSNVDGASRRRKERKGTYPFDTLNYDEMSPLHTNHLIEEDGIEMDDHGMVNLSSVSALERASFFALASCSRLEMALTEVQSIPHENLPRVNLLIDKLHELSAAASMVESLLKDLAVAPDSPVHSPTIEDNLKPQKLRKSCVRSSRKRLQSTEIKEEMIDSGKKSRLTDNGSHDEESFDQHCESGEMTEYDGEGLEIVVDDEDVEDDREMKK